MSFCQLAIQACEHVRQISVDRQYSDSLVEVGSHYLHIADGSEHGAHPLQLIALMLCL